MRKVKRILAVFDDCGPGDALCLTFCLSAVRKAHPDATIDLLVSARAWPVFENANGFGRVIMSSLYSNAPGARSLPRILKVFELVRLAIKLGPRYDTAITFLWGTTAINLLTRWASRRSFGYANRLQWLLTSRLGRYPPDGEPIQLAINLLASADISANPEVPYIPFQRHSARQVEPRLARAMHVAPRAAQLVVIHTGSDWACQQWLPERWAIVADRLIERYGAEVVFTGVAEESDYVEDIRSRMHHRSRSLAGKTTVGQLTDLLTRAALCVCVDVLIYELAQAVGTRIVLLAGQSRTQAVVGGPSLPIVVNRTTPELRGAILRCKTRVEKASYGGCHHYSCVMAGLRDITVEDVLQAIEAQDVLAPLPPQRLLEAEA